jgi:hypothetical protein
VKYQLFHLPIQDKKNKTCCVDGIYSNLIYFVHAENLIALTLLTDCRIFIRPVSTVVYTITDVYWRDTDMILAPATMVQIYLYNLQA